VLALLAGRQLTARKDMLRLPARTPAYVTRKEGAAELRISLTTWDAWVKDGTLPQPAPGFPASVPRWRWLDVDSRMAGRDLSDDGEKAQAGPVVDVGAERAAFLRDGPSPRSRHPASRARAQSHVEGP
jgi:hypothetical protein